MEATAPTLPRSANLNPWLVTLLLAAGVAARLSIATLGSNFDLGCWSMAGDLARGGKNVYAVDPYYNYGPVWLGIVTAIRFLQHLTNWYGPDSFHLLVVVVLASVDVAVCLMLIRRYSQMTGLFFFFCPVLMLLTGFHSQIDTLAISLALASWLLLEPRAEHTASISRLLLAAGLMGLSLASKHICLLFPLWIVMNPAIGPLVHRLLFTAISFLLLISSLLPFCLTTAGLHGVFEHVIQYHGVLNNSLFTDVLNLLLPYRLLELNIHGFDPIPIVLQIIFFGLLTGVGHWCRRKPTDRLLANYLLAATLLTTSMADQYLAIPLVACAIFYRHWAAWAYVLAATLVLLISPFNISSAAALPALDHFATRARPMAIREPLAGNDTAQWMTAAPPLVGYPTAQIWLIPLLLKDQLKFRRDSR